MLFSFRGDCRSRRSYSFRFYWHVSVSFLMLPVAFIGVCYFYLDLCDEVVVLFLHYDTSVNFLSFLKWFSPSRSQGCINIWNYI